MGKKNNVKKDKKNDNKVILNSEKVKRRQKRIKILKISLLAILLFLSVIYLLLKIVYASGKFVIKLDESLAEGGGLVMYENIDGKINKKILAAEAPATLDNISIDRLPANINDSNGGSHNGDNYIAYTFFIQNRNVEAMNYWYQVNIDDVIKGVDEAVRFMIILNGEKTVYAKAKSNGDPEPNTEKFHSDKYAVLKNRQNLAPDGIDKYTIVIWLEGNDPQCIDNIIGGEMKMHMEFYKELTTEEKNNE